MKYRMLALFLCLCICVSTLSGCSSKYNFQYAFFPITIESVNAEQDVDFESMEIDEKYISLIKTHLESLTSFVNEKFHLNISKPMPKVKAYIPTGQTLASYYEGTIYLYVDGITDDETFGIIHELIHYLSENNGLVGFMHENFSRDKTTIWGHGLTEGFTDLITVIYLEENNLPLPKHIAEKTDYYSEMRDLAQTYYMLEPKTIEWLFNSDYKNMSSFVYTNLNSVANIPAEYKNIDDFDLVFYAYTDTLLDTITGKLQDDYSFQLMFTASFEIAAVAVRACPDKQIQKNIYNNILINHDQYNTIKDMIFS